MRTILYITLILQIAISCSSPEEQTNIQNLIVEKDSLKSLISEYNSRISEINKLIAENGENFEASLTLVKTKTITESPFKHSFTIYGEVATDKNVLLYPELGGLIKSINVEEGDKVSKGQLLLSVDDQIIRNQISEVRTAYELAKTTFDKQERLWNQNIGSEIQYLQAKNQKESLESSLETLNSQLSKTRIKAPFSGTVDEIFPKEGEMGSPQMPVIRIVNLEKMYIESDVSEQHLLAVSNGTPVKVKFPNLNSSLDAHIDETSKFINPENRSFKIKVNLPEADFELKPNQLAHLDINDYISEKAIVIPSEFVMQTSEGEDYVYTLEEKEGKQYAKRVMVETGKEQAGNVEIVGGLEIEMQVITEGARSVRDGQRVRLS